MQCKWVYRTNMVVDGSYKNYKEILVSKVFYQVHGMDYRETFAPVAKMDTIMLVLSIATSKRWKVHHMDVKTDFIHGDLHEEIYMQNLEGFIHDPSLVFILKKSLYGLKQAPEAWYAKMDNFLLSLGFER